MHIPLQETAISPIPSGTLHESDAYSASGLTAIQKAKKAMQNWVGIPSSWLDHLVLTLRY